MPGGTARSIDPAYTSTRLPAGTAERGRQATSPSPMRPAGRQVLL